MIRILLTNIKGSAQIQIENELLLRIGGKNAHIQPLKR